MGKRKAWLGPMARKFFIYLKETKMCADHLFCARQTNAAARREEPVPMAKWSVEPWQGKEEKQAWAEGHGRPPGGSTIIPLLLLSVVGNTKRKRVG